MKKYILLLMAATMATLSAQKLTDLTAITGSAVDPTVDLLLINDTSAGTAGSKKITLAELVNVSSFTNGNFLAADSIEFTQVNGLTAALALKAPLISPSFTTPALGTPASGNFSSGTFTWPTFNQNTTGSAATLTTPRTINGTSFNGSANITVTAAAGTLTGSTLASGVTASSLTSVGILSALEVTNNTSLGGTAYANVRLNLIGSLSGAGNMYGVYTGGLTLAPGNGSSSYFQYFGGTTSTSAGSISSAIGAYISPLLKSGAGSLTSTYGIYQEGSGQGVSNYGAYFADPVGVGTITPTAKLDINSDIIRLRSSKTPASASASGNAGDVCWDSSYIYVCTATNTWKRVAIATW